MLTYEKFEIMYWSQYWPSTVIRSYSCHRHRWYFPVTFSVTYSIDPYPFRVRIELPRNLSSMYGTARYPFCCIIELLWYFSSYVTVFVPDLWVWCRWYPLFQIIFGFPKHTSVVPSFHGGIILIILTYAFLISYTLTLTGPGSAAQITPMIWSLNFLKISPLRGLVM